MSEKLFLLIEDNECDRVNFKRAFTKIADPSVSLTICNNAKSGMDAIKNCNFTLIFTDLHLPDSVSPEEHLQNLISATESPITVITDFDDPASIDLLSRYKIYDYLIKGDLTPSILKRSILYAQARFESDEFSRKVQVTAHEQDIIKSLEGLTGGIAHDLNNKLALMKGHLNSLCKDVKGLSSHSRVDKIQQKISESSNLISQLLAYSKNQELNMQGTEINELLEQFSDELKTELDGTDIQISIHKSNKPIETKMDFDRLKQALINLVKNSVEAMGTTGEIQIFVKSMDAVPANLLDSFCSDSPIFQIKIVDSGRGIAPANLLKVTAPFFSTKETNNTSGSGLGLSVVQGIVSQMGGTMLIASEQNKGTTVDLYFPKLKALTLDQKSPSVTSEEHKLNSQTKKSTPESNLTLLYVEDDLELQELIADELRDLGYTLFTANNGEEGLELYLKHRLEINCIVTDVKMPKMTGTEMYSAIRDCSAEIGFVFVSGYSEKSLSKNGKMPSRCRFFGKPCGMDEVNAAIHELAIVVQKKLAA